MSVGHVLLTILAVIGWTLLAILALIILLLLIVLLVPIRYKANAHVTRRKEEFEADVKATWLLHLVSGGFTYKGNLFEPNLKIAFKRIMPETEEDEERRIRKELKRQEKEEKKQKKEKNTEESSSEETENKAPAVVEETKASEPAVVEIVRNDEPAKQDKSDDHESVGQKLGKKHTKRDKDKKDKGRKKKDRKLAKRREPKEPGLSVIDRVFEIIDEIQFAGEDILEFLTNPTHQKVLKLLKKRLVKFGKKLLPSRLEIEGTAGFDNPYHTGLTAALMCAVYPYIEKVRLPELDYENEVLDLTGLIKGKLRLGSAVNMILPLLLNLNTWRTIKDAKRLKEKLERSSKVIKEGGKAA